MEKSFTITVSGANDAPVITAPDTLSPPEDSTNFPLTGISYTDLDDFGGTQTLTLSVTHGTLTLGTTTGLTFAAGSNGSASMTVTGTKEALNAALDNLGYTPTADYHGADELSITIVDKAGGTGAGSEGSIGVGDQTSTKTISLNDRRTPNAIRYVRQ